jgi:hypothetical protein
LLAELKTEALKQGPTRRPAKLPVKALKCVPALFQPRNAKEDERHTGDLVRAIRNVGMLDPILVMYVGQHPYVIDGHHRVAAYEVAKVTAPVPVEYFQGTLEEAVAAAGRANSKAKLPMQPQERQNYAWKLVLLGAYSKSKIVEAAGVSARQVGYMRTVKSDLGAAAFDCVEWWVARQRAEGTNREWSDEQRQVWEEERADELVGEIMKACGPKLTRDTRIAALVLERLFGRSLDEVVRYLGYLPQGENSEEFTDF